jgi:HK97 family phage major capsid protein
MSQMEEFTREFNRFYDEAVKSRRDIEKELREVRQIAEDAGANAMEAAQRVARRQGGGLDGSAAAGWGAVISSSQALRDFRSNGYRGVHRLEVRNIGSGSTGAGPLIAPDRQSEVITLAKRRMTVRQLLGAGQTSSNVIYFMKQTGFTNAAAPVAEGQLKPQSDITFTAAETPVRTIAHWIPVSRQAFDDAPALSSLIDSELRYGLEYVEEQQMLLGDGSGENLHGMIPQATAYETDRDEADDTEADTVAHAIAQAEIAQLPATGIILNTDDWNRIILLKDGTDQYLGGGPFGNQSRNLWTLPVATTPAMPARKFLVGAFGTAVQIFDRLNVEVLISDQDRDNFIRNMLTVRAEQRLALAVKRPEALIYGTFPQTVGG